MKTSNLTPLLRAVSHYHFVTLVHSTQGRLTWGSLRFLFHRARNAALSSIK